MKYLIVYIFAIISVSSFSQEKDKEKEALLALKKANNFVYEGNEKAVNDDFVSAEMAYRKALSEQSSSVAGAYNLGTSYIEEGSYNEALYRLLQATKSATSKEEKHKAFHNIGNILMKENKCQEAVDAYKNALRNNPSDNETRYNLALAKKCAEDQKDKQDQQDDSKDDQNKDQDQDENKENEDNKDKEEGDNKEDNKDQGDQDKKEGDDQKDDEGKPKDDKQDQGKGEDEKKEQQKPKPQQGQLTPQQVKNLLEAMNNQEQKVQEKMNAEKQKGVKIQTEKDW